MTLTQTLPAYLALEVQVADVRRISPSFVRVTFSGDDLSELHAGGPQGLRDTRIKLVVPDRPGHPPRAQIDVTDPGWYRRWMAIDPAVRGHLRTYTVRRVVPEQPSPLLEVDFAIHLHPDSSGPAGRWVAQARAGQRLTILGPNRRHPEPGGFEWKPPPPPEDGTQPVLLVGDETALPAIAAILERLPRRYAGAALVEVPCLEDVQELVAPPGFQVTYLPRNGGVRGAATLDALEKRPLTNDLYAWVAGEATVVREVRRALVGSHGLSREQVTFMGYWRQGRAEG